MNIVDCTDELSVTIRYTSPIKPGQHAMDDCETNLALTLPNPPKASIMYAVKIAEAILKNAFVAWTVCPREYTSSASRSPTRTPRTRGT